MSHNVTSIVVTLHPFHNTSSMYLQFAIPHKTFYKHYMQRSKRIHSSMNF